MCVLMTCPYTSFWEGHLPSCPPLPFPPLSFIPPILTPPPNQAMDLCDEMRALRLNPTKEGYAFIASIAIRDGKTYLVARTLETMQQEGFDAEVN